MIVNTYFEEILKEGRRYREDCGGSGCGGAEEPRSDCGGSGCGFRESVHRMNECGGWGGSWGGCGSSFFDDDYFERQRINRERRKRAVKSFTSKFMKEISKDDPDYNYYKRASEDALRSNADFDYERFCKYLRDRVNEYKKQERSALLSKNRNEYYAAHGITPQMLAAKKNAMSYESKARSLRREADEMDDLAVQYWEKAGGKDLWANFRLPHPNANGEYVG